MDINKLKQLDGLVLALSISGIFVAVRDELERLKLGYKDDPSNRMNNDRIVRVLDIKTHLQKAMDLAKDYE